MLDLDHHRERMGSHGRWTHRNTEPVRAGPQIDGRAVNVPTPTVHHAKQGRPRAGRSHLHGNRNHLIHNGAAGILHPCDRRVVGPGSADIQYVHANASPAERCDLAHGVVPREQSVGNHDHVGGFTLGDMGLREA